MTVDDASPTMVGCAVALAPAAAGRPQAAATAAGQGRRPVTEASLTTITLTAEAVGRLGIETAPVEQQRHVADADRGRRSDSAPAGAVTTVTAPFAGTLEAAAARRGPARR